MFTESERTDLVEQTKDRLDDTKYYKTTKPGTILERNSKGNTSDSSLLQEKYVVIEGKLKLIKDVEKSTYDKLIKAVNFDKSIKEKCKIKLYI